MNNPDASDLPDTDPFEFEYPFAGGKLNVEAQITDGAAEVLSCKFGNEDFCIEDIAICSYDTFSYDDLDDLLENAAIKYWEDVR